MRFINRLTKHQYNSLPIPIIDSDIAGLLPSEHLNLNTDQLLASSEVTARCTDEDRNRAIALRSMPLAASKEFDPRWPTTLADWLDAGAESGCPPETLASALYAEEQRRRLMAATLELMHDGRRRFGLPDVGVIEITHPTWRLGGSHRWDDFAKLVVVKNLRTMLDRANVTDAPGYLAVFLHGEFNPNTQEVQLRFRGVGAGRKLTLLRELQATPRTESLRPYYRITVHERSSFDVLLRTIPTFVLEKAVGSSGGKEIQLSGQQVLRAEEPYHSLYLLYLNNQHVKDMCLFNGAAIQNGHLVVDTHGKTIRRIRTWEQISNQQQELDGELADITRELADVKRELSAIDAYEAAKSGMAQSRRMRALRAINIR